jgi:hypothetical protein
MEAQARTAHVDPLMQHDFGMIQKLKAEEFRRGMGIEAPVEYSGKASGVMSKLMPSSE